MRIHIAFDFTESWRGGGNQFLHLLRREWQRRGVYTSDPSHAQAILFNSHNFLGHIALYKAFYRRACFVQRVDGPMRAYNPHDRRDRWVRLGSRWLADGLIFQSVWSRQANRKEGLHMRPLTTIIHNAPDEEVFYPPPVRLLHTPVRLVAASWSSNRNKGFDTYSWLDRHLNWNDYSMVFIGNSPIPFRHIRHVPPQSSLKLADYFRSSDIFIFGSRVEACSNTLLEALACGLPTIAFKGTSTTELVGNRALLFSEPSDIPWLLDRLKTDYSFFGTPALPPPLRDVAQRYYTFLQTVWKWRFRK